MDTCIYFLKASQGDCFLIETYDLDDNKIFIMIDGEFHILLGSI